MVFTKPLSAALGVAALVSSVAAQATIPDNPPKFDYGTANPNYPGVKGANSNGPTNPDAPMMNTPINQTSDARLASLNSVTDWCTFGPAGTGEPLGNVEGETVAWCTLPRNNARVIPDGTITAAHFVKTPLYVQLMALGDFTRIGLPEGDEGGELDPHGATNMGNPVGGNVTSNVSGEDVFYEEWMNYVSYNQVCFRICIAGSEQAPTALECQHQLDVMGCNFVMPGNYADNVFETCDGDSAYPPGLYPDGNGQTSTFQQYYTGEYVVNGQTMTYQNGSPDQVTPTAAYSTPATSNCQTTTSPANGIKSIVPASASTSSKKPESSNGGGSSGSGSGSGSSNTNASSSTGGNSASSASHRVPVALLAAGLFAAVFVL